MTRASETFLRYDGKSPQRRDNSIQLLYVSYHQLEGLLHKQKRTHRSAFSKQEIPSLLAAPFILLPIFATFTLVAATSLFFLTPFFFAISLPYLHFQFCFVRSESRQSVSVAAGRPAAALSTPSQALAHCKRTGGHHPLRNVVPLRHRDGTHRCH